MKNKRKGREVFQAPSYWQSYSDMMAGVLLLFILIMCVTLFQAQKSYNESIKERDDKIALQEQYTAEILAQQSELDEKNSKLSSQDEQLDKQKKLLAELAAQLKEHSITRKYRAIVHGVIKEDEGTVDAPIGRHPTERKKMASGVKNGKRAVTHYRVLERFQGYTYVECQLETGRTHQIRVHMASIHHPLLGDTVYGPAKDSHHLEGQTLHAMVLGLIHPVTGEYLEVEAPLPEYFENLLKKFRAMSGN